MIFGVLKDIKEGENRVICTPLEVASIVAAGHTVMVQKGAGVTVEKLLVFCTLLQPETQIPIFDIGQKTVDGGKRKVDRCGAFSQKGNGICVHRSLL